MPQGRPYNSLTPAYRSLPAMSICVWKLQRYLNNEEMTKSACARDLGLSRHTVIKWWDTIEWNHEMHVAFSRYVQLRSTFRETTPEAMDALRRYIKQPIELAWLMEGISRAANRMANVWELILIF